jgi:hypothetical protein
MSVPTGVKISALPPAEAANDTDQMEVNQGGISRRVTVSQIASVANASVFNVLNVRDDFGAVGDGETDDTAAFTAAGASGKTVRVPEGEYYIPNGGIVVASQTHFIGDHRGTSRIKINTTTTNPLFTIGSSDNVIFRNLYLEGNLPSHHTTSASTAIRGDAGCSDIVIDSCVIINWMQHGIWLDGVTRADIRNNLVQGTWLGAGIATGSGTLAHDVKVTNNTVIDTQWANIHLLAGVDGLIVTGNYCDGTGKGLAGGAGADNITSYVVANGAKDFVVTNNVCRNSNNHGIHVAAHSMVVSNNTIYKPKSYGIIIAGYPNDFPPMVANALISNNNIEWDDYGAGPPVNNNTGIAIRNTAGFTITGNVITSANEGIQIFAMDGPDHNDPITGLPDPLPAIGTSCHGGAITGNRLSNIWQYGLQFRGTGSLRSIIVEGNAFNGTTLNAAAEDIRYNAGTIDTVVVGNNYSNGFPIILRKLQLTASNTGSISPALKAIGSQTDLNLWLAPKGAGVVVVKPDGVIGTASTSQAFFKATSTSPNLGFYYGNGTPNAVLSAGKGSFYTQVDATTTTTRLWVNTNGASAWTNLTTAA